MACGGLSDAELVAIEQTHGLRFPPDLRAFLRDRPRISQWERASILTRLLEKQCGETLTDHSTPPPDVTQGWMNWRTPAAEIAARLTWPFEGVAAALETSDWPAAWGAALETNCWPAAWGTRPDSLEERLVRLRVAPRLVPINDGQHYMAVEPCEPGNPVFSVHGADIIVAGCDLEDYLAGGVRSAETRGRARHIPFWSDIAYDRC